MDNDENKLKKRFAELSLRAVEQRRTVSSDFLTLDEQSTLAESPLSRQDRRRSGDFIMSLKQDSFL